MIAARLLAVLMFAFGCTAHAKEVYNFYFQKKSPPAEVKSSVERKTPVALKPKETEVSKMPKFMQMELGIQKTEVYSVAQIIEKNAQNSDDVAGRDALSIAGTYRFNKFVATEGTVLFVGRWKKGNDKFNSHPSESIGGSIGLSLTPIHMNLFGYELLELGVTSGMMSATKFKFQEDASEELDSGEEKKLFGLYFGLKFAINLTSNVGVVYDYKSVRGLDSNHSLGLRYRF